MTNSTDLIGLVKDLRAEQERLRAEMDKGLSEALIADRQDQRLCGRIYEHFPAITKALLTAVEALEAVASDKTCLAVQCRCGGSNDEIGKKRVAEQALARIHSLSPQ